MIKKISLRKIEQEAPSQKKCKASLMSNLMTLMMIEIINNSNYSANFWNLFFHRRDIKTIF